MKFTVETVIQSVGHKAKIREQTAGNRKQEAKGQHRGNSGQAGRKQDGGIRKQRAS